MTKSRKKLKGDVKPEDENVKKVELYEGVTHIPFGLKGVNYKRGQKFVTENKSTFEHLKGKFLIK